jgi:hypothetical protein
MRTARIWTFAVIVAATAMHWSPSVAAQTSSAPATPSATAAPPALVSDVLKQLNDNPRTVKGTESNKSFKILFDAYLTLTPPPTPIGPEFNLNTIYPKMPNWSAVSGWAEANLKMDEAILKCKDKVMSGLPYGVDGLPPGYLKADVVAEIAVGGSLRNNQFRYLKALDTIAAYCTAETYRLMEAGKVQEALDLSVAHLFILRQFCDRDFLLEKTHSLELLSDALSNLRDVFYTYTDKISAEQFTHIASWEIPYLRPDRSRLLMPEADRIVAAALINEVFDAGTDQASVDKFSSTFAEIQSQDSPLTRLGAAKRWRIIATVHGSRTASLDRLRLIYDDWWRRWQVQEYDDILAFQTQFDRTNPIRYAAVIYSMQNLANLFSIRNQLRVEVNGTAMAAGLCAYKREFGTFPDQSEKVYSQFVRRRSDSDPYDKEVAAFHYLFLKSRQALDTQFGRLWIEPDQKQCLLWSVGQDHEDNRASPHTDDGLTGDIVIWPPIKALARQAGKLN